MLHGSICVQGNLTCNVTGDVGWAASIFLPFKAWIITLFVCKVLKNAESKYCLSL